MSRLWTVMIVLAVCLGVCAVSLGAPKREGKKDRPKQTIEQQFAKMDANADKKVTEDEFVAVRGKKDPNKAKEAWAKLAKGKKELTLDEFKAAFEKKGKKGKKAEPQEQEKKAEEKKPSCSA